MYIGIDVGGTKTLVACLEDNGVIIEEIKIATSWDYQQFLEDVKKAFSSLGHQDYIGGTIAVPASSIDRPAGLAKRFGNLPWRDVSVASDVAQFIGCPLFMENDAKLGGLSESMLLKDEFDRLLYVTIGTGIGYAFIENQKIQSTAGDGGGRILLVENNGKYVPWETLAAGRAIVQRYGQQAQDINDPAVWQQIAPDLAKGLIALIAIFTPQVIIIGGGVGEYFAKFEKPLKEALYKYRLLAGIIPEIRGAKRPNEAVIYGCYDYAKQKLNDG